MEPLIRCGNTLEENSNKENNNRVRRLQKEKLAPLENSLNILA
jgi:hypothetical protein